MCQKDIYRLFHPNTKEFIIFSAPHEILLKIDHILGHKASLSKYRKIEIAPCILSGHHGFKLDTKENRKYTNEWEMKNR